MYKAWSQCSFNVIISKIKVPHNKFHSNITLAKFTFGLILCSLFIKTSFHKVTQKNSSYCDIRQGLKDVKLHEVLWFCPKLPDSSATISQF